MTSELIFFTLCVIFGGQDDCSHQWVIVDDRQQFEAIYRSYNGPDDPSLVAGFTVYPEKIIYAYKDRWLEVIVHEYKHVLCSLEHEATGSDIMDLVKCNYWVDARDYMAQSNRV